MLDINGFFLLSVSNYGVSIKAGNNSKTAKLHCRFEDIFHSINIRYCFEKIVLPTLSFDIGIKQ